MKRGLKNKLTGVLQVSLLSVSGLLLAACEVETEREGRLPSVDVDVVEEGQLPNYEVRKTQEGRMPKVDVDADAGRLPKFDVETADVEVGTKEITVTVPDVDIDMPKDDDK